MKYLFLALFLALPATAHAEPVPESVLNHDYMNCMGGETAQHDPERAQYCRCVMDSMRSWSVDDYGQVAMEQQKASTAQQVPQKIADIAKACIAKVLK